MTSFYFVLILCALPTEESLFSRAPADWHAEVIPFPLAFAPEIKLSGVEELRFAPGMFVADAPDYFSYAFIWWLEGSQDIDAAMLEANLLHYFRGLYATVSKKAAKDTSGFTVDIRATRERAWIEGASSQFRGTAVWIDPFVTEQRLVLHMKIAAWYCTEAGRTAVFFLISAQSAEHDIWRQLHDMRAGTCRQ